MTPLHDGDVGGFGGVVEDEGTVVSCFEHFSGVMVCVELILSVSDKFGVVGILWESCGGSVELAFLMVGVVGVTALVVSMAWSGDS